MSSAYSGRKSFCSISLTKKQNKTKQKNKNKNKTKQKKITRKFGSQMQYAHATGTLIIGVMTRHSR